MSILKRKIFSMAMVVFSIVIGAAALVNILQNRQSIAAAEEVADDSPDAGLGKWLGCIPNCTFRFDVTDYSLEYVGYSKKYRRRSYLVKN